MVSEANLLSPPKSLRPTITNLHLSSHPPSLCVICRDVQEVSWHRPAEIPTTFGRQRDPIGADANSFPSRSGLSSIARAGRFSAPRSAISHSALRAPITNRWASTAAAAAGVGNGKIHQVSRVAPFARDARPVGR
ncbi:hypothetical protein IMZ48_48645 [Candidatus Bathyarchaeota archaeon]|nr:hypothetical protein [Candidatus Bathyarchaeota archaeon]